MPIDFNTHIYIYIHAYIHTFLPICVSIYTHFYKSVATTPLHHLLSPRYTICHNRKFVDFYDFYHFFDTVLYSIIIIFECILFLMKSIKNVIYFVIRTHTYIHIYIYNEYNDDEYHIKWPQVLTPHRLNMADVF